MNLFYIHLIVLSSSLFLCCPILPYVTFMHGRMCSRFPFSNYTQLGAVICSWQRSLTISGDGCKSLHVNLWRQASKLRRGTMAALYCQVKGEKPWWLICGRVASERGEERMWWNQPGCKVLECNERRCKQVQKTSVENTRANMLCDTTLNWVKFISVRRKHT